MMRFWVGIFFLLIITTTNSQNADRAEFVLKPSLGLNACQIHGDNYSGYKKLGIFGGVAVNSYLGERLSLELGFYFSQKGARKNQTKDNFSYYRLNLNYLDMPLSVRFMLNERYFVSFGPSIAYLISYYENIDNTNYTGVYNFKKYDVGLNIGLGRTIVNKLSVEVRCSNSISAIRTWGSNNFSSTVFYPNAVARYFNKGFYNNILTLMLTYQLDQKKQGERD